MNRKLFFAGVVAAIAMAAPASAQVTVDMSEVTCKQFSEYDADTKAFIGNWLRGYLSATKNLSTVDSRYVKRNTDKTLAYCKKHPKDSLLSVGEKIGR
jgi:acid stress chaperone HdeB